MIEPDRSRRGGVALEKTYRDQSTYRGRIFEGRRRGGTVKEVPGS